MQNCRVKQTNECSEFIYKIVPSHLSHSLVCVALSIDNVMGFILLSVVDLEDRGFVLSNKRKYQLDDLTRWFMYHVR